MGRPLLEVRHLSIQFVGGRSPWRPVVSDVSFQLSSGETLAVVGESGSGKSLTALAVMGLLPPGARASGHIVWQGQEIQDWPEKQWRKLRGRDMGMVFQEPMSSLNPLLTCGYQTAEVLRVHEGLTAREAKKRTLQLFESVRLPDPERIWRSYPHQVSGGQKQRVMIAMAMACHPRLLIADEPTTALDATVQREILELFRGLQKQYGMGLLFISHDLMLVQELAHRVLVMYQGRAVETGPVHQVMETPEAAYTRGLLACRPPLTGRPARLPMLEDFLQAEKKSTESIKVPKFPKPTEKVLLKVENLNVRYPIKYNWMGRAAEWLEAVKDVSFSVHEGEVLGLAGPSGCGKSTLGRAVLALQPVYSGRVLFKDQDLLRLNPSDLRKIRREIQVVFQDPYAALNPRLRVGEAIAEPIRVHRLAPDGRSARHKAMELLEKVGLKPEHYDRFPHEFSGGQRQRICIARALSVQPSFLVCDESVAALDVSVQAQILNLLNDLRAEMGLSFLFISHDLNVVRYMSHRLCIMHQGTIVEQGPADDIFQNPQSLYTRSLLEAIPKPQKKVL
ncbi:MAG: ABC transporter ATP-binding protein [Flavobacteriales bacterium]|nr:ABC transporter ATP-binding protein [Flavobacteriales bacterium]